MKMNEESINQSGKLSDMTQPRGGTSVQRRIGIGIGTEKGETLFLFRGRLFGMRMPKILQSIFHPHPHPNNQLF
jgi:hypothetical protein